MNVKGELKPLYCYYCMALRLIDGTSLTFFYPDDDEYIKATRRNDIKRLTLLGKFGIPDYVIEY